MIITDFSQMDLFDFVRYALSCPDSFAGGGKAVPIPDMPGWKGYEVLVPERNWRLVDRYWVNEHGMSGGFTCMWSAKDVKMCMAYQGHYPKEVTPFLREALLAGYAKRGDFMGFRGPSFYGPKGSKYTYKNALDPDFRHHSQFRAHERIYTKKSVQDRTAEDEFSALDATDWKEAGYHFIQGLVSF